MKTLSEIGQKSKMATYQLANATSIDKDKALKLISEGLIEHMDEIVAANQKDLENAKRKGISGALLDRLKLNEERIKAISEAVLDIVALDDPIGEVMHMWKQPNGMTIGKKRVPLGVIGIIYEARPNVTVDAAVLCLKTGNAVILRGGSEAIHSNIALGSVMAQCVEAAGLPEGTIQIVEDTSRETATEMMRLNDYIDVLIPRGGAGLIQAVVKNATVPVIETGTGNCHIYVDRDGDKEMAINIIMNAKTSRPGVCNAAESLLVDEAVAADFLPLIAKPLLDFPVEIRGCEKTKALLSAYGDDIKSATEEDYGKEFLDYILSVKIVADIDDAIAHINKYGTGHSEAIITTSYNKSQQFHQQVDAAAVYVNASTRFTDGGEFGFGAEIGISTQKLHARGPMGLKELTTTKYIIFGDGQIR
ncbi:MAG: glutamate-5-semialdehyde dehydrogenase [Clostridia bacterium]|nr:glutamate-5-semialdehyde dehydrogenase [Clostridia bacterium]